MILKKQKNILQLKINYAISETVWCKQACNSRGAETNLKRDLRTSYLYAATRPVESHKSVTTLIKTSTNIIMTNRGVLTDC